MTARSKRATAVAIALIVAVAAGVAAAVVHEQGARRAAIGAPLADVRVRWSAPRTLADCSAPGAPRVLFPQLTPFRRIGEGAVVFLGGRRCRYGEDAALAAIGPDDRPRPPHVLATHGGGPTAISGPLAATATTKGQIVLAGERPSPVGSMALVELSEGAASGAATLSPSWPGAEIPVAASSAYLGDVALAACPAAGEGGVQLRVQRHFQSALGRPVALSGRRPSPRPCGALSLALDYRTDALAVWRHGGWLYARERREDGALGPLQRFARASDKVQLSAVISDDDRAIVAWVDPGKRGASLHLDISGPGMVLGPGKVIERLRWDRGHPPAEGWVRLVRLSTEGVLMGWTGTEAGHFAVRRANVTLLGLRDVKTLSGRGEGAELEDLSTGPHGDALAVWIGSKPVLGRPHASSRRARPRAGHTALMAYWMTARSRRAAGRPRPQTIADTAAASGAAIDPGTGTAFLAWRAPDGTIRYALGRPSAT
jgi:hypothetical protein